MMATGGGESAEVSATAESFIQPSTATTDEPIIQQQQQLQEPNPWIFTNQPLSSPDPMELDRKKRAKQAAISPLAKPFNAEPVAKVANTTQESPGKKSPLANRQSRSPSPVSSANLVLQEAQQTAPVPETATTNVPVKDRIQPVSPRPTTEVPAIIPSSQKSPIQSPKLLTGSSYHASCAPIQDPNPDPITSGMYNPAMFPSDPAATLQHQPTMNSVQSFGHPRESAGASPTFTPKLYPDLHSMAAAVAPAPAPEVSQTAFAAIPDLPTIPGVTTVPIDLDTTEQELESSLAFRMKEFREQQLQQPGGPYSHVDLQRRFQNTELLMNSHLFFF
jgi:hypothetical protein